MAMSKAQIEAKIAALEAKKDKTAAEKAELAKLKQMLKSIPDRSREAQRKQMSEMRGTPKEKHRVPGPTRVAPPSAVKRKTLITK